MRLSAMDPGAEHYKAVDETGNELPATAFDTDELWVEVFVGRGTTGDGRWIIHNRNLVKAKLRINYDIVDKRTGETVYIVRQCK